MPALSLVKLYGLTALVFFAIVPALEAGTVTRAVTLGAFFGLVAYATFDLTCMALFKDFPLVVVAVDLLWGTVLTGTVATAGFFLGRWLGLS